MTSQRFYFFNVIFEFFKHLKIKFIKLHIIEYSSQLNNLK